MRVAISHCCYYRKSFLELNSKSPSNMSSFGAFIISNWQVPPQRELLLIDCYWEYECEWSTELFSSLKVVLVITIECSVCTLYCCVLERHVTKALHLLLCEWNKPAVRHTTQALHLLWLMKQWKWNKWCLLSGVSALSTVTCWRDMLWGNCVC